jgi:hypothetical protein
MDNPLIAINKNKVSCPNPFRTFSNINHTGQSVFPGYSSGMGEVAAHLYYRGPGSEKKRGPGRISVWSNQNLTGL